ncbi:MAG TPA: L-fucose mutarotase [Polyangiaceae bacterium]|jgi:L-fucose mutarotase|nr:L-fucose mutarotase [Polyangiaceae bacterium]
MLKGISPLVGPDLLSLLSRMGHGDELVLADAHFPGERCAQRLLRADGLTIAPLLDGVLALFELDQYEPPLLMMAPVTGDRLDPNIEASYLAVVARHAQNVPPVVRLERNAFYERARQAFGVVMTSDTAQYANLILKKGVTGLARR